MTIVRTNALIIMLIVACACIGLCVLAGQGVPGVMKASFIFSVGGAAAILSMAMTFAQGFEPAGGRRILRFDLNATAAVVCALLVLGAMIVSIDVSVFTDSVFEAVASATIGALGGIMNAYAKKDGE